MSRLDVELFQAALIGLQQKRDEIDARMADIRKRIGATSALTVDRVARPPKARRTLSAAARRRIVAAQKKRWAEFRRRKKQLAKGAR